MHADTDHARQAVMLQIQLLERLESVDKTFAGDLEVAKAYTRLAMVEEAGGRPDEEQRALAQARAHYDRVHSHSKEPTDDEMKKAIKLWDGAADRF